MALLRVRLGSAAHGLGGVALISGEPGIGKSRLIAELGNLGRAGGWRVLTGFAYDTEGMPPYLPFVEALQEYLRTAPLGDLRAQLGDGAAEVGRLLPDILRGVPDIEPGQALEPQGQRHRMFQGISEFFREISRSEPVGVLLCLEDLHWADEATLLLLEHVSRHLEATRVLIVGSYRDTETSPDSRLAAVMEQLARRDGLLRMELKRLRLEDVGRMLGALGGSPPPAPVTRAFQAETEGNPFFVQAVFEYLSQAGRLFDSGGAWRADISITETDVPFSARLVIGRRLRSVSPRCQQMLGLAAVIGRTFNFELLFAVAESPVVDEAALLDDIDEAVAANLLASSLQRISFAHELIRQTVFSSLSQPRRQSLHIRIAAAIESLYASDLDAYLADLTAHYASAGTSEARKKTLEYATRAGDRAVALLAFEEALRLYDIAEGVIESRSPVQQMDLSEIVLKRAQVLVALARWPDARLAFQTAASHVTGERRANILLSLAGAALRGTRIDVPLARGAAEEGLAIATELESPELQVTATGLLAECDLDDGEIRSALAHYEGAYSRGITLQLPQHRQFLSFPRALYWAGRIEDAVKRGHDEVEGARRALDVASDVMASGDLGLALASSGRYIEALEAFAYAKARALADGIPRLRPHVARTVGMSIVVPQSLFDHARVEALAEETRDLARSADFMLPYVSAGIDLMCAYCRLGDLERADAMATEVAELLHHGVGSHEPIWNARLAEARAEVALARGDLSGAVALADNAVDLAGVIGRPKYEAMSLSVRGAAFMRRGRSRDGLADLRLAVETARPVGDPAVLLGALAALLAFDHDDAFAAEAQGLTDRIEASLPEDRVAAFQAAGPVQLVRRLGQAPQGAPSSRNVHPDGLTEREVEVLRLIASGKSSREIGEELVLSVRTVERHIANIYVKTDSHGRAQVTVYALNHGLG